MKQPIKVVMLPTEDKTLLVSLQMFGKTKLHLCETILPLEKEERYMYTYVTVPQDVEPIKEGDWVYFHSEDVIIRFNSKIYGLSDCRKIIATTDPKLTIECKKGTCTRGCPEHFHKCMEANLIPQLQQSFIKEFVANPDGKWEIEYEVTKCDRDNDETCCELINCVGWILGNQIQPKGEDCDHRFKLRLNQDNTVNITSVEERMYSRDEVIKLIANYALASTGTYKEKFNDWIKENL